MAARRTDCIYAVLETYSNMYISVYSYTSDTKLVGVRS